MSEETATESPVSKVTFSQLTGKEPQRDLDPLSERELSRFQNLTVDIEVVFGQTKLPLQALAHLEVGSLLPFDQVTDEPVTILAGGKPVGRGEIVTIDGHYAVKILSLKSS